MESPFLCSLDGLSIIDRVVRTRGEFYSEKWYVPYFASLVKGGHYSYVERDEDKNAWHICLVTESCRKVFPDLEYVVTVGVRWDGKKCLSWVRSCSYQKRH